MPERHRYAEIAALVGAIGHPWFGRTLQGVLQTLFHYDHFLLARYRRAESLTVLAHDLGGLEARRAVRWLERENFVLEPIFRLHAAGHPIEGVHDMRELVVRERALDPPTAETARLPHLVADTNEEMGWRTMGWPRHQQETCVLVETGPRTLIAVSLYDMGLVRGDHRSAHLLEAIHPILAAVLAQHARSPAGRTAFCPGQASEPAAEDASSTNRPAGAADVRRFFVETFDVEPTARELDVFRRLLNGATPSLIARELDMSIATVRTHRRNVYRRIGHTRLPDLMNAFFHFVTASSDEAARDPRPASMSATRTRPQARPLPST